MQIKVNAVFETPVYGGQPYLTGNELVKRWLESQKKKLMHPTHKELQNALTNEKKLEEILSIFNVLPSKNGDNIPIIGNWMLKRCSINAQKLANTWGKFGVSADRWKDLVQFTPNHCHFFRGGKAVTEPDDVKSYTVTIKVGGNTRSFMKAYQLIDAGVSIDFIVHVPDDLCEKTDGKGKDKIFVPDTEKSEACGKAVIDMMGIAGLGAYRERFGKFKCKYDI